MLVLPEYANTVGPLRIVNEELVNSIGGAELLQSRSVFLVGSAGIANQVAEDGKRIIVGVTDTYLANKRQVFFPLPDGTWLGVKGSGYLQKEINEPIKAQGASKEYYWGYADMDEVNTALKGLVVTKNKRQFIQFLGYRSVFRFPDGKGGFRDPPGKDHPAIIFNRTLTPHRLCGFRELIREDPGLERLRRRISNTLCNLGYLPQGTVFSFPDFICMVMAELGRAEALKQNNKFTKYQIHDQDFTLAGEETDNEELLTIQQYSNLHYKGQLSGKYNDQDMDLLRIHNLITSGICAKVDALSSLFNGLNSEQISVLMPEPIKALEALFKGYFGEVNTEYLELWMQQYKSSYNGRPSLLPMRYLDIGSLHPLNSFINPDLNLENLAVGMVVKLAKAELEGRAKNHEQMVTSSLAAGPARPVSSPMQESQDDLGGVDMRHLAKNTIVENSGDSSPRASVSKNRLGTGSPYANKELEEIQRLIQAGIIPSIKRLQECRHSCSAEDLLSCVADILRMEEERAAATEPDLKNLLVLAEKDS